MPATSLNHVSAEILMDTVEKMGARLAAESKITTATQKITAMLGAIATKCNLCKTDINGHTKLHEVAECSEECPLQLIGPTVFQKILDDLERLGKPAGGVQ